MDEKNLDSMAYAFKGRIMISSVVLLFLACLVIVLFHVFARCRSRRRLNHHNRRRRHHRRTAATVISSHGLDLTAINSLPHFIYESKSQGSPLECAVCLSEFEDDEAGRVLPECNHCFHVDCIDMWLQSHCDCPLCRCRVMGQPGVIRAESVGNPVDGAVSVIVPEDMRSGSDSGLNRIPESEGIRLGGASRGLIGPMEQYPTKTGDDRDPIPTGIGPDLELGSRHPGRSARVLKILFST